MVDALILKKKKPILKIKKKTTTSQIKRLTKSIIKPREKENFGPDSLVPTSSTLLNCACSDIPTGGYGLGKLVNIIGDSSSGKTFLALSCLAEMAMYKRFDDYDFIYDDVEAALEFNLDYLFGTEISDRIDMLTVSDTIQSFYGNIVNKIEEGRPFIYILDSLDAITSIEEMERAKLMGKKSSGAKLTQKEKNSKGGWKTEKARMVSEILRVITRDIKALEAVVIVISQTRDNLGWGFTDKTRSGGKALKFYSTHEMWLSIMETITAKQRAIGVSTKAKVSKNKITGKWPRFCEFPIFYDYGVDDLTANIDFLIANKVWEKGKAKRTNPKTEKTPESRTIIAPHFKLEGTKQKIITEIELRSLEKDLQLLVGETWNNIEESIRLNRKPKYAQNNL